MFDRFGAHKSRYPKQGQSPTSPQPFLEDAVASGKSGAKAEGEVPAPPSGLTTTSEKTGELLLEGSPVPKAWVSALVSRRHPARIAVRVG